MKLYNKEVNEFIDLVDSKMPTPGGGSSSALMSVLGVSLARMVGHLTVTKKNFLSLNDDIQKEFNSALQSLLELKDKIIPLIDEDSASYNAIIAAYRMPRETDEEKSLRRKQIKEATIGAIEIPFKIAKLSLETFNHLDIILEHGNVSAISDVGVSILALSSGVEGALYNVLINLIGMKDQDVVKHYKDETNRILKEMNSYKEKSLKIIYEKLEF